MTDVAGLLRAQRWRYTTEDGLQQAVEQVLADAGLEPVREVRLAPRDRALPAILHSTPGLAAAGRSPDAADHHVDASPCTSSPSELVDGGARGVPPTVAGIRRWAARDVTRTRQPVRRLGAAMVLLALVLGLLIAPDEPLRSPLGLAVAVLAVAGLVVYASAPSRRP